MKSTDISFYFVLYLVAVMTVFAITVERDKTLEERNAVIKHLVEVYVKPLKVSSYTDTTRFYTVQNSPKMTDSVRLKVRTEGPISRNDITFKLLAIHQISGENEHSREAEGTTHNDGGDGVIVAPPLEEGVYKFTISGHKDRIKIDGKKMKVDIGGVMYDIPFNEQTAAIDLDTTEVFVRVARSGREESQLTMNVTDASENWVVGPPYSKKIFVGGVENLEGVDFTVSPTGKMDKSKTEAFATFTWDRPTTGKHEFKVNAHGNRAVGAKDNAAISFSVDVHPATFSNAPPEKGFWGIPYKFDGQIVGLNPLDLTVESAHDGQPIASGPAVPPTTVTPTRNWNSLSFKVLYHGTVIKEAKASLSAPPPPQVKWTSQNLDRGRGVFVISLNAQDAAGGPVTVSMSTQPSGIAKIDKIRGTNFTITVDLSGKPASIFIKLTVSDQYGGQNTSSKQFNISQ